MQSFFFSEQSYTPAWNEPGSPKITSPSAPVDPVVARRLLNEYIAQCVHADRLGLDIMVNEHHASYLCMSVSCLMMLGILATHTKRARLLALGVPIMNRMDPMRIAEEAALVDVLSGGRLELGLIKGNPLEAYTANANHSHSMKRFWEAHDLILRALTSQDGSFSWEGENFQYRHVNVVPRCHQQPHPPVWLTTLGGATVKQCAQYDYVLSIPGMVAAARRSFPVYREEYQKVHGRPPALDRLAFLALVAVGRTEKEAEERGRKLLKFVQIQDRSAREPGINHMLNPPGSLSPADNARLLRAGSLTPHRSKRLPDGTPMSDPPTVREQIINEILFCGTPDQVYEQLRGFYESCGGFGRLLLQMGGEMSHDEILDSLTLYANEVQPRLAELTASHEYA